MIVRLKRKPGQKGTKKLLAEHRDGLFCARYRYDEARKKRIKTVEIVVEESDWHQPVPKACDDDRVVAQIGCADRDLRDAARTARGRWDPDARL